MTSDEGERTEKISIDLSRKLASSTPIHLESGSRWRHVLIAHLVFNATKKQSHMKGEFMTKMIYHRLSAVFLWAVLMALPTSALATHSWNGYHWARTQNPFTLMLGDNTSLSNLWLNYLNTTSAYWNAPTGGWSQMVITNPVAGKNLSNLRKCPPTNGRVEVCNYTYGTNGWLGVAQIWVTGSHIYQGTVKLNDSYFNNSRYPKYNSSAWRNMVMCQEVGHTFGLDHQDTNFSNANLGTCMDYTSDPTAPNSNGKDNEFPNDHDYEELAIIYAHTNDTGTTVAQTIAAGNSTAARLQDDDEDSPRGTGQWGKLVRSTNGGRTETYELDLGHGQKMITHVIWAD
jgi:hypothetical protein